MSDKNFSGADLKLNYLAESGMFEDVELATTNRLENIISKYTEIEDLKRQRDNIDLKVTTDIENIIQSLVNRLKTIKGELEPLGHPEYGSRHHELIGELNTETNRSLVKLYILEAFSHEPRIEEIIRSEVQTSTNDRTRIDVHLQIKIFKISNPINLVVPFYFESR